MINFIVRRLIQIPLVMLVLSLLLVGVTQLLTPEQRAAPYIRGDNQASRIEQIIEQRGLRDPFPVQYGRWASGAVQGDLGFSRASGKDVIETIKERLPNTIELTLLTAIPILLLSVWLGSLSALNKDKFIDQVLRVLTILGYSLPTFVLGIVLLAVFYAYLGWLPGAGQLEVINQFAVSDMKRYTGMLSVDAMLNGRWNVAWDALRHMILPAATLAIVSSADIIKVMRNSMLDVLSSDYIRTARAKGLTPGVVNRKHARRNALLPIITLGGLLVINLLSGSLITETIFAYPGIGQWVVQSALQIDLAGVLGFALLSALIVVVMNTLVDILYGIVDPRVRFD
ncbi:ABC transporter permease [Deinococcus wulumuqiensis]|jgi:peptide/nickel transport system permease protein|uniref:ABC transporter permease n=1 Tax=Deinococcus wulumuqiensis TaxID=980427 RepID=A0A345IJK9_9DEIO|nr:ABC transporter permease [Deinococcus wulumuqiensis]AXG99881.1 ABC transporter permease [Deinococcus wulumuqiensis]QII21020.1 ABC transporter permease [Deinococcus wulumuqiensis R12]GGI79959.1 peptide ABC transporter permease [Deinococcus wulumuqiensis]GGP29031.1 peptide ABC transporter permease [Deinococcus wulumuqiensis]